MIEEITIKFGTELKPTQYSWKSQLYNLPFWLFRDKTPKQTLDLKHEFGNTGKTHSHLNLKAMKHLHQKHLYPETLAHNYKTSLSSETSRTQGTYMEQVKCNQDIKRDI